MCKGSLTPPIHFHTKSQEEEKSISNLFHLQEAIRDQKIELKEIEADYLGTEKEYKIPEKNDDKNKSKSSTSKS